MRGITGIDAKQTGSLRAFVGDIKAAADASTVYEKAATIQTTSGAGSIIMAVVMGSSEIALTYQCAFRYLDLILLFLYLSPIS